MIALNAHEFDASFTSNMIFLLRHLHYMHFVFVCMCLCMYINELLYRHISQIKAIACCNIKTYKQTNMHTCITYTHTYIYAYMYLYICKYLYIIKSWHCYKVWIYITQHYSQWIKKFFDTYIHTYTLLLYSLSTYTYICIYTCKILQVLYNQLRTRIKYFNYHVKLLRINAAF